MKISWLQRIREPLVIQCDATSYIQALLTPDEQTTTSQFDATTGLMLRTTDALTRQTTFAYNSGGCGNMTGITSLAGTETVVTTTMACQTSTINNPCASAFNQVTSITALPYQSGLSIRRVLGMGPWSKPSSLEQEGI